MRKNITGAFLTWLLCLSGFLSVTFFCGSMIALLCAALWCLIPPVTCLLNLIARNYLDITVSLPVSASKKEEQAGRITIYNRSILPVAKLYCRIVLENRLTQEQEQLVLRLSSVPKGETTGSFAVTSDYCGYLRAEISGCWLMDWAGFLPVRCRVKAEAKEVVLPDTFLPHVVLKTAPVMREDADAWSQIHKGNDQTEVFALRDYVPGDSLKQIHWKLSSKRGQLIVKEASLPIEKSLLIFWDKNTQKALPGEMDAMAECVASVSQAILSQGYTFTLGWTEGSQLFFEYIGDEDQLLQTVPRMLKCGSELSSGSGAFLQSQQGSRNEYGKVIYLARTIPEDFEAFSCTDMTMLLCGMPELETEWRTVVFHPDTILEDLEILEL